jgi:hypothetical protein
VYEIKDFVFMSSVLAKSSKHTGHATTLKWHGAIKKIEPLKGVIFTLPTNKVLNFSRIDNSYMEKKVPCHMELCSLAM